LIVHETEVSIFNHCCRRQRVWKIENFGLRTGENLENPQELADSPTLVDGTSEFSDVGTFTKDLLVPAHSVATLCGDPQLVTPWSASRMRRLAGPAGCAAHRQTGGTRGAPPRGPPRGTPVFRIDGCLSFASSRIMRPPAGEGRRGGETSSRLSARSPCTVQWLGGLASCPIGGT
jgi:hypothetical protein